MWEHSLAESEERRSREQRWRKPWASPSMREMEVRGCPARAEGACPEGLGAHAGEVIESFQGKGP